MFHVEQCKMFHVEQYKMFHVEQCKINVPRETMHKGSCLGGRGQQRRRLLVAEGGSGFGCFGLRRQLSAPVGAASASSGSGGCLKRREARLRLLRAPLGAGRCSSSGFVCSPLLGLLGFGRRWAASLCFASLRHPSPRHPSRSVCLRPTRFRSAAPLRPALPPPLPPSASSSRLRPPLPPPLPPSATSSRLRPS